jgi:flagellar hook-associated protein 2
VVNSASSLAGRQVNVSLSGGALQFTSQAYGKASSIENFAGKAIDAFGFTGSESSVGLDVAGRFIVNGQIESAKGTGRLLVGDKDNEFTGDLQVRVTLGPGQITAGTEGTLDLTRGITSNLDKTISDLLNAELGLLSTVNKQFDEQIESFDSSISRVESITAAKRDYLTVQFANLERILGELQTTSSILTGQLASLNTKK